MWKYYLLFEDVYTCFEFEIHCMIFTIDVELLNNLDRYFFKMFYQQHKWSGGLLDVLLGYKGYISLTGGECASEHRLQRARDQRARVTRPVEQRRIVRPQQH